MSELRLIGQSGLCQENHSQYGEGGILLTLFSQLGIDSGYFCEFGAWDGRHLSNTFALYERGWMGCYIEGDPDRFLDLQRNITRPGMALVCAYVTVRGDNGIGSILARHLPAGVDLDLLSIDIDSDDLEIWKSLTTTRPKVVVIEFNPSIPFDVRYVNPAGKNRGNSARSIWEFAHSSGYGLVAVTHCNLVFVDTAVNGGRIAQLKLDDIGVNVGYRYFFGYDGTLMVIDPSTGLVSEPEFISVPWSRSVFPQPVVQFFRRFDEGSLRSRVGGLLSRLSAATRRPLAVLRELRRRH